MKIVFFISRRQLDNFSFSKMLNRKNYQFIAIISNQDLATFPAIAKSYFDFIHGVDGVGDDFLTELDYEQVCLTMKNHINRFQSKPTDISIICQDEANILLAGKLRDFFHIKTGAKGSELEVFRDKVLMKNKLKEKGIRTPHFISLCKNDVFTDIANRIGIPFIVKPTSAAGSFGVYKISMQSDYDKFITENESRTSQYEAEEFIEGDLFHCDMVVKNKIMLFQECCVYACPNLDFQKGMALGSLAILHDDPVFKTLSEFAKKSLFALGAPEGCHHMELFINKSHEVIFLEVGARSPGFITSRVYENTFGRNPLDMDLNIQADITFAGENKKLIPSFYALFPIKKGKILGIREPQLTSDFEITWVVKVGQETKECKSNLDFGAILFVYNTDYNILKNDFKKTAHHKAFIY